MQWYIECNNLILLINFLEFKRAIALIAVKNQKAIGAYGIVLYMPFKVL